MTRYSTILVAVFCLLFLSTAAHGWWCNGHMLVAEIARRNLKPEVSAMMDVITSNLSASGPFPKISNFVELACWSDDLKAEKLYSMGGWHYIDTPYNPENVTIKKSPVEDKNVLTVSDDLVETLKNPDASPYVVNFALANLVHFYGDIHQPLHNMDLFSKDLPDGDDGGNRISVVMMNTTMKLHAVWDSMCQGPQEDPERPLSKGNYKKLMKFADYLVETQQFADHQMKETNMTVISRESYDIGVMATYNGVTNGMTLSDAYITRCAWFSENRVALAGYRLATRLNDLFG